MPDSRPITGPELQQLKQFWLEEDDRNGGRSDTTRCIEEIERLQALLAERQIGNDPFFPGIHHEQRCLMDRMICGDCFHDEKTGKRVDPPKH